MNMLNFCLILATITGTAFSRISCKGLNGESVDWFIVYKLPQGINGSDGRSFVYSDAKNPSFSLSKRLIDDRHSSVGATLEQVYRNDKSALSFMYSDDSPTSKSDSYRGHAKGVLNFDSATGFWLIHSVPNYPPLNSYSYPRTGVKYAQSFICVTVDAVFLNQIGEHLRYIQATPFSIALPESFAAKYPILRTIAQKKSLTSSATQFTLKNEMHTVNGQKIITFATHKKFGGDIWMNLVAPTTGASLAVQTWLNGGADDIGSICLPGQNVWDIDEIDILGSRFSSSKDHSKWGVSYSSDIPLVCVGDLNRQMSQFKRGGGVLCLLHQGIWRTFHDAVSEVAACRTKSVQPATPIIILLILLSIALFRFE